MKKITHAITIYAVNMMWDDFSPKKLTSYCSNWHDIIDTLYAFELPTSDNYLLEINDIKDIKVDLHNSKIIIDDKYFIDHSTLHFGFDFYDTYFIEILNNFKIENFDETIDLLTKGKEYFLEKYAIEYSYKEMLTGTVDLIYLMDLENMILWCEEIINEFEKLIKINKNRKLDFFVEKEFKYMTCENISEKNDYLKLFESIINFAKKEKDKFEKLLIIEDIIN